MRNQQHPLSKLKMKKFLLIAIILLSWQLPSSAQELFFGFTFDTVCKGNYSHFEAFPAPDTINPPADSIVSWSWDLYGTGVFASPTGPSESILYTKGGIHTVGLKVTTFSGLSKILYHLVPVNSLKTAFTANAGCVQEPVVFSNKTISLGDTNIQWFWKFGDGTISQGVKNPVHKYPDTGLYRVTLIAGFLTGCIDSTSTTISVTGGPVVTLEFSQDTIIRAGDTLIASVIGSYDSIIWSTNARTNSIAITKAGYYSVKAYKKACYGQKGFHVVVKEPSTGGPQIMTLFTPNSDGFNDLWQILNLADVKPCQVNVFDRYGTQVLSSSDYQNNWDGTFNGKRLANDTYYYFVRCSNQELLKGNVNILR